jgi:hypothetical protein
MNENELKRLFAQSFESAPDLPRGLTPDDVLERAVVVAFDGERAVFEVEHHAAVVRYDIGEATGIKWPPDASLYPPVAEFFVSWARFEFDVRSGERRRLPAAREQERVLSTAAPVDAWAFGVFIEMELRGGRLFIKWADREAVVQTEEDALAFADAVAVGTDDGAWIAKDVGEAAREAAAPILRRSVQRLKEELRAFALDRWKLYRPSLEKTERP